MNSHYPLTRSCALLALLCMAVCASSAQGQPATDWFMTAPMTYDVDYEGHVIAADQETGAFRVLGASGIDLDEHPLVVNVWAIPGRRRLLLLIPSLPDSQAALYIFDTDVGESRPTGIDLNPAGDWAVLPVAENAVFVSYCRSPDIPRMECTILDAANNRLSNGFDFHIDDITLWAADEGGATALFAHPWGSEVREVDLPSGEVVATKDFGQIPGIAGRGEPFVGGLGDGCALVRLNGGEDERRTVELAVADVKTMSIVARSQAAPYFQGAFWVRRAGHQVHVYCVEREIVSGKYVPTGRIRTFATENGLLREGPTERYEPEHERILKLESGLWKRVRRKEVGYFSRIAASHEAYRKLPPAVLSSPALVQTFMEEEYREFLRSKREASEADAAQPSEHQADSGTNP